MTKEQFDNYKFSVKTIINFFEDFWDEITEVDYENRTISIKRGQIVKYNEIKGIQQV